MCKGPKLKQPLLPLIFLANIRQHAVFTDMQFVLTQADVQCQRVKQYWNSVFLNDLTQHLSHLHFMIEKGHYSRVKILKKYVSSLTEIINSFDIQFCDYQEDTETNFSWYPFVTSSVDFNYYLTEMLTEFLDHHHHSALQSKHGVVIRHQSSPDFLSFLETAS
jgi:hypothetical protein